MNDPFSRTSETGCSGIDASSRLADAEKRSISSKATLRSASDCSEQNSPSALSGRSHVHALPGFSILGTGSYVPDRVVTNDDLSKLGCDHDWIVQRTGIRERRQADDCQAASDLAYLAAIDCLKKSNVAADQVDLIIVATITADHSTPSTACILQHRLGCTAAAMDVNAACSGFMYALVTAGLYVRAGLAKKALVIGAEVMLRTIDPTDVKSYPLFGDGAGAVLVVPSEAPHLGGLDACTLGSEGEGGPSLCVQGGGSRQPLTAEGIEQGLQYMRMDGRAVFKWAVRLIKDTANDCLTYSCLTPADIQHVVMHQANIRILESAAANIGFRPETIALNLDRYGNTSAASIPLVLDQLATSGKLKRGERVFLCGFGAGLTWGTAVLRW